MQLDEASLSRIWQHSKKNRPIAIISAYRNEKPKKKNESNHAELIQSVRKAGYGFFKVQGHWIEDKGKSTEKKVKEPSLFIVGNDEDENPSFKKFLETNKLKQFLLGLVRKYDQDAGIIKPSNEEDFHLLLPNGTTKKIGKFTPNKVADEYSRLNKGNRTFVFESIDYPETYMSRLVSKAEK